MSTIVGQPANYTYLNVHNKCRLKSKTSRYIIYSDRACQIKTPTYQATHSNLNKSSSAIAYHLVEEVLPLLLLLQYLPSLFLSNLLLQWPGQGGLSHNPSQCQRHIPAGSMTAMLEGNIFILR